MSGLFAAAAPTFGAGSFSAPSPFPPTEFVRSPDEQKVRQGIRAACPDRPGVYGMLNAEGQWIYVGKSKQLRTRLLSYFRIKTRASKERRILDRTVAVGWEPAPSEFAALLRELELIQRWRPPYNIKGQPGSRRHTYLCVGRPPVAQLYLAKKPDADAVAWFGPVPEGMKTKEAMRRLSDWFGLRDCPKNVPLSFADQKELFPILRSPGCLRFELKTCLGPCVAACSQEAYAERVRRVRDFLSGEDATPLVQLERDIQGCSERLEFERAAGLDLLLNELRWMLEHLGRLRVAKGEYSFVFPQKSVDKERLWYLIHGGLVVAVLPQPADRVGAERAAAKITETFARPPIYTSPGGIRELDLLLLVASWFRQHPDDLNRTMGASDAVAFCNRLIDGNAKPATRRKRKIVETASPPG